MICIDRIRIRGFRGIANLEMTFTDTCVLIGPNNSGKTSVLRALEMALSESLHIVEQDFYCASGICQDTFPTSTFCRSAQF